MALGSYTGPRASHAFTAYFRARFEEYAEELSYRRYLTDAIMYLGQGKAPSVSWFDILTKPAVQDFDPEKVADDIVARLGGDDR